MPLFMDLHIIPGARAEDVAEAHVKDLYCQDQYGCKAITYWFDEDRGKAFCLIEAPDAQAVKELHQNAHGLIPNQVVAVDPVMVESFLGRLTDPDGPGVREYNGLKVFENTAYRYLMYVDIPDFILLHSQCKTLPVSELEAFALSALEKIPAIYKGRRVSGKKEYCYSFTQFESALACALRLRADFLARSPLLRLSFAINAGEPLDSETGFFEGALGLLTAIKYCNLPGMITLSSGISNSEISAAMTGLNETQEGVELFSSDKERFLFKLINALGHTFMSPDLDVGLLASKLAYSNSKLYRLCNEFTGISPNRFIRAYRLNMAKQLLLSNHRSIAEVGFQCGFNTPSYFTRCFQQTYGVTPIDYKSARCSVNEF